MNNNNQPLSPNIARLLDIAALLNRKLNNISAKNALSSSESLSYAKPWLVILSKSNNK